MLDPPKRNSRLLLTISPAALSDPELSLRQSPRLLPPAGFSFSELVRCAFRSLIAASLVCPKPSLDQQLQSDAFLLLFFFYPGAPRDKQGFSQSVGGPTSRSTISFVIKGRKENAALLPPSFKDRLILARRRKLLDPCIFAGRCGGEHVPSLHPLRGRPRRPISLFLCPSIARFRRRMRNAEP